MAAYNAAQTHEKENDFWTCCATLRRHRRAGAPEERSPALPIQDALFAACYKIYSTVSGRRFMTDLREAQAKGYHRQGSALQFDLQLSRKSRAHARSAGDDHRKQLPLKAVEVDFAADSRASRLRAFVRWFDHKYGAVRQQHEWVKVHLMCGVRTNIVTAVEIRDKDASDTKLLPALVDATAQNFQLREVSADKGYGSLKNYKAIQHHGAMPYIAFKSIHTGRAGGLWQQDVPYFQFHRAEFLRHYHKRSNVESTFSMIKAKFRDHVRSKTDVAMINEVLCKIICHNICCLIQESHELGIDTDFWEAA